MASDNHQQFRNAKALFASYVCTLKWNGCAACKLIYAAHSGRECQSHDRLPCIRSKHEAKQQWNDLFIAFADILHNSHQDKQKTKLRTLRYNVANYCLRPLTQHLSWNFGFSSIKMHELHVSNFKKVFFFPFQRQ